MNAFNNFMRNNLEKMNVYITKQGQLIPDIKRFSIYALISIVSFWVAWTWSDILLDLYYSFREKNSVEETLIIFYVFGFMISMFMASFDFFSDMYKNSLSSNQK